MKHFKGGATYLSLGISGIEQLPMLFWVITPYRIVSRYHALKMGVVCFSETSVSTSERF
jgi:hypothetical protein